MGTVDLFLLLLIHIDRIKAYIDDLDLTIPVPTLNRGFQLILLFSFSSVVLFLGHCCIDYYSIYIA